jgi:hypothetical protein
MREGGVAVVSAYHATAEPVGICTCPRCNDALIEGENPPVVTNLPDPWAVAS